MSTSVSGASPVSQSAFALLSGYVAAVKAPPPTAAEQPTPARSTSTPAISAVAASGAVTGQQDTATVVPGVTDPLRLRRSASSEESTDAFTSSTGRQDAEARENGVGGTVDLKL